LLGAVEIRPERERRADRRWQLLGRKRGSAACLLIAREPTAGKQLATVRFAWSEQGYRCC